MQIGKTLVLQKHN